MKSEFCAKNKGIPQTWVSFCWITLKFLKKRGFSKKLWLSVELNSKDWHSNCCLLKNYEKRERLFINIVFYDFELWILAESVFLLQIFILNKNHGLLGNPLIPIQDLNTNFHLEPKNRKPKIWDSQKKEKIPYPRCGFGACLRCEWAS